MSTESTKDHTDHGMTRNLRIANGCKHPDTLAVIYNCQYVYNNNLWITGSYNSAEAEDLRRNTRRVAEMLRMEHYRFKQRR
jgi:hypothetical protein